MPENYRNNNYQGGGNRPRVGGNPGYGGGGNRQGGGHPQQERANAQTEFAHLNYQSSWITSEANSNLVTFAENSGKFMARNGLTNSKIRSIYGEIKRIQMSKFENEKSAFILLKPKVAYALGRDANNEGLKLFKLIFDRCSTDVSDQKSYQNFCNFMEAILAYHKANGGKD